MAQELDAAIRTLEGMGFQKDDIVEALRKYNNAVEPALEWLLVSRPSPGKTAASFLSESTSVKNNTSDSHNVVINGHNAISNGFKTIPNGHNHTPNGINPPNTITAPNNIPASNTVPLHSNPINIPGHHTATISDPSPPPAYPSFSSSVSTLSSTLSSGHTASMAQVSVSLEDDNFTPLWPDEKQLRMAIKKSLQDQEGRDLSTLEPIDPNKRKRERNLPVGLKNIGCTCYFNSLVQTYYMLPTFRNSILGLEANDFSSLSETSHECKALKFVYALQQLFAFLKLSERKYVDPSNVFNSLVEMHASRVKPGTEQDPTEFNMLFMQSISDGLSAHTKLNSSVMFSVPTVPVPPKKHTEEPDLVKHLFLGSSFQTILAKEAEGSVSQTPGLQQFNHIILDICHGDLYSSLDAYTAPVPLKDYVTGKNYKTPSAFKTETFEKLPRLLTFQLQRVNYDIQRKEAVKLNNQFGFDKTIYLDRYMHRNERETAQRRERAVAAQSEIHALETELAWYESTEAGLAIEQQIANVAEFLRTFAHHKIERPDAVRSALAALGDQVRYRAQEIKAQIVQKKKEIANLFNDMRQYEYRLHAVLVHDGRAGSGHYWAYVQDPFSQSKWYRFDDTNVEEVTEQVVWSQSTGGEHEGTTSSAYCLMYLHQSSSAAPPSANGQHIPWGVGSVNLHTITGFHPAIASLHPIPPFYSPTPSPIYLAKNNKAGDPLPSPPPPSRPSPPSLSLSPFHPQTLLSTSPPLFSARNLLIDSPVLIPVSVKALVDSDNRTFEEEVLQWDLRVLQEMDNAALSEHVSSFISKYQAKIAECVSDCDGDPKLKSFAHYLLGINSQDLMQYVIAEECYASTFPPSSASPPSSPSHDVPRARLEEDQGSEAVRKIEAELSHVQLHLTFPQKATLALLQKEYAQFAHVAELYIYAVHFLVDGWYRESVLALLLALNHEQHKLMYSLAQNSRAGEIRRVLPLCVRRLSAQAADLLANAHVNAHADAPPMCTTPMRQALEMAKLVAIGSAVALELRTAVVPAHGSASPALSCASPSLLHQALNHSDNVQKTKLSDSLESTQDLLSIWENVALNCTDLSVRGLCEEILEICHSCKIRDLDRWLGDTSLPQFQQPPSCSASSSSSPFSSPLPALPPHPPLPLPHNNIYTRHVHANQLLDTFLTRHRAFLASIDK